VDERVDDTLQTTAGEEIVAEQELSYEEYNKSYSQEVERLLIYVAELEKQKAEPQSTSALKEPTAGLDAAFLLPVVFAGIRTKKCVAAMFSPCRLSLSGWGKRGHPFINPKIDQAIDLAKDLECCHDLHWDHDQTGQFFTCHAERQLLMERLEYMQGEGKVFTCDTSIDVCDDCKHFFNMAAGYLNIEVWINGDRYGYA
jgi:hypothetical protein